MTDRSASMVGIAAKKVAEAELKVPCVCEQADAQTLPYPNDSFDTVVDTFGLCSADDPVAMLSEAARVCRPGGSVLLLEHGKSIYPMVSWYLDWRAPLHAKRWGMFN